VFTLDVPGVLLEECGLRHGDYVEISKNKDALYLVKAPGVCAFCGAPTRNIVKGDKGICPACADIAKKAP
jgi:hypothetical protein